MVDHYKAADQAGARGDAAYDAGRIDLAGALYALRQCHTSAAWARDDGADCRAELAEIREAAWRVSAHVREAFGR